MQDHTNTIIELQNVSFSYSNEVVLKDITLSIHKGDYVGIVGPNGGGKSTLLKIMLGVLKPQKGIIKLFGVDINNFKEWYKIGYVPQKTYVEINFPITVEEVVAMGRFAKRGLFRFPNSDDKSRVIEALKQVSMEDYKNRQLSDLSGGQQQRVFIARALVSDPEVIFLDEPTAGVDVKTQKQFYDLLRELNTELNLTLVLVSHELDVLGHESSELGYINRSIVYFGSPHEFMQGKYFHELIGKGGLHQTDV
jgi:zinc transport system ATP-binding protein